MNNTTGQTRFLWATVIAMTTLSLWLMLAWRTDSEAQSTNKGLYEYGELFTNVVLTTSNPSGSVEISWETRNSRITAKSYKELCEKLGGRVAYDASTPVLNLLADKGWELVTHTSTEAASPATEVTLSGYIRQSQAWTFRRRR